MSQTDLYHTTQPAGESRSDHNMQPMCTTSQELGAETAAVPKPGSSAMFLQGWGMLWQWQLGRS